MDLNQSPEYADNAVLPVRYGTRPDDRVPHSWAESMLTQLRQENSRLFGKLLQAAAIDEQS